MKEVFGRMPVEGIYNLRDAGGYPAFGSRFVKTGLVYRGGDFDNLTPEALANFRKLGIRSVVDFRGEDEIVKASAPAPSSIMTRHWLPIGPASQTELEKMMERGAFSAMKEIYRYLVSDFQDVYRNFFQILMNGDHMPLLFHCAAGKDRTGYAAALFLSSLGVNREDIIYDYMLSNTFLGDKYAALIAQNPHFAPLMRVDAAYLESALEMIELEYGGMRRYLTDKLHVDMERMRELYTDETLGNPPLSKKA